MPKMLRTYIATLLLLALAACATPATPDNAQQPTSAPTSAPTSQPTTQPAPTSAPTNQPTAPPATAVIDPTGTPTSAPTTQPAAQPTAQPQPTPGAAQFESEILFLRGGALIAFDVQARTERQLADSVRDFATTPDGGTFALVREVERVTDLWTIRRDGSALTQITNDGNDRIEATPSWAPDGMSLLFATSDTSDQYTHEWPGWAQWCKTSELRLFQLPQQAEVPLGAGCDPAFSPDGLRIAYAAPPTEAEPGLDTNGPNIINTLRLINRKGQNGWDFARASGPAAPAPNTGRLVYAPAWSPDGQQIVYQRFLGYQALVDIDLTEIAGSYKGDGQPLSTGAGWMLPAAFAPTGNRVALSDNNYSDARGFGGYDNWSVTVIRLEGSRDIQLPSQTITAIGQQVNQLPRGQRVAWSPDGETLAVELPPGWQPNLDPYQQLGVGEEPGEIWLWQPGEAPQERLISNVDFASPLAWLPPAPQIEQGAGYQLAYPAGWSLAAPTEFEERTAVGPDGLRLMSAATSQVDDPMTATVDQMFAYFVNAGGQNADPLVWPDGSVYRAFTAIDTQGRAVAGASRIVQTPEGVVIALYVTTPERWPFERALAQALLARCGPLP